MTVDDVQYKKMEYNIQQTLPHEANTFLKFGLAS